MTDIDRRGDWITIAGQSLSAAINPLGAELSSLMDGEGREYMTDADPRWWTGRAPVLFPIVGALNRDTYRLAGKPYRLAKHGFARNTRFDPVEHADDAVSFRLVDSAETHAVYPFAFVLIVQFRIEARTLHVVATVANPGDTPLPFSLGFHPAFAWPLPGGVPKDAHRVIFADPEPQPIRRIDGKGLLKPETFPTPIDSGVLVPATGLFEADALIWDQLASRQVTFGADGGAHLDIAFPDAPMLGIWQKPGAPYLCIEPWHGIADPVGFAGDFQDKPGIVLLAPGGEWCFRMDVTVATA